MVLAFTKSSDEDVCHRQTLQLVAAVFYRRIMGNYT